MLRLHPDRALEPSTWTVGEYSDMSTQVEQLDIADDNLPSNVVEAFHGDVFADLYQFETKENEQRTPDGELVGDLLSLCRDIPEYDDLSRRCALDPFLAYVSASCLVKEPLSALSDVLQNDEAQETEPGKLLDDELHQSHVRRAARRSVADAVEEAEEIQEAAANGWGLDPGQSWEQTSLEEKKAFRRQLRDHQVRDLLSLAGRWKRAMQHQRKSREAGIAVSNIELGADLDRLLPSELVSLRHPLMRKLFYRRLLERGCLQYDLHERRPTDRGPVIILNDQSASMKGEPDTEAKAMILAVEHTLRQEQRKLLAIPFAVDVGGSDSFYLPGDNLTKFCRSFMNGGGTDFVAPLNKALDVIAKGEGWEKADVILLTDGLAGIDYASMEKFKSTFLGEDGPQLFSIVVGYAEAPQLEELGDVIFVRDLVSHREALASALQRRLDSFAPSQNT